MDLKETIAAAKAEGLSYGEYVTRHSPPVDVKVPEGLESQKDKAPPKAPDPEPEGVEKICPVCGKTFLAADGQNRKKYCSVSCRNAGAYQRSRQKDGKAPPASPPAAEKPVRQEPEKRAFTFGGILDLLGRDSTEVTVINGDDNLTGAASSSLWKPLEDRIVTGISPEDEDTMNVWLRGEDL